LTLAGWSVDDVTGDDQALDILTRQQALNFAPGTAHLYSNSGYFLASQIVERVTGGSLRAFARDRIFEPLGMRHTLYRDDHTELVPHRATAYAPREEGGYRIDVSNWEQLGDGAVFTTVEDLIRWDANFYDPRVGGPALLEALQRPGRLADGTMLGYALGLSVSDYRGARSVSHGGSWGGYRAELLRLPDHHLSVAVLCNLATTNPSALARRVVDVLVGDQLGPVAVQSPRPRGGEAEPPSFDLGAGELAAYAGSYYSDELDTTFRVQPIEGGIALERRSGSPIELTPRGRDLFADDGFTVRFERSAAGAITGFVLDRGRVRGLRFERTEAGNGAAGTPASR
ncbi:MAG: serine hydrolase domain-containing protein, partial [Longimicrobiales bacterium]